MISNYGKIPNKNDLKNKLKIKVKIKGSDPFIFSAVRDRLGAK
jgi:hypothetical protein